MSTTSCLHDSDLAWLPMHPGLAGVEIKYIFVDTANDELTCLLKIPAGMALPRHRHEGPVLVHTLQGEWRYREYDWVARAGSTVREPAGSCHTPIALAHNKIDVVTFNIMRGDLVLISKAGNTIARENCNNALERLLKFDGGVNSPGAMHVAKSAQQ